MEIIEITPAQHIQYAHASVDVINNILASGSLDSDAKESLKRNAEHLAIICDKDYASQFSNDIAIFQAAIVAAQVAPQA